MSLIEPASETRPLRWREVFAEGRAGLTVGLLLVELLVAIQALVLVAIMPAVRHDLGGVQFYGLVFSAYMLSGLISTPIAGRWSDRLGPARPFAVFGAIFLAGTVLSAIAPSMPLLAGARVLAGIGAGGTVIIPYSASTRIFPEPVRARVLALLAAAWVIPGLIGPSYGALLASTVGWRWAFLSLIPVIVLATALTFINLLPVPAGNLEDSTLQVRWPLQLGAGVALALAGLATITLFTVPAVVIGLALAIPALARILPPGSLVARPGLPAAVACIFLTDLAYIGSDYFVPLMLTAVRHRSLAVAGIVLTLGTVSWSAGSWWQSRVVLRRDRVGLVRLGSALTLLGVVGMLASMLEAVPILLPYIAWPLGGLGMGILYPTLQLIVMAAAPTGSEGRVLSSAQVADRLAFGIGGGLGGSCIALAYALHATIGVGLAAAFVVGAVAAALALLLSSQIVRRD